MESHPIPTKRFRISLEESAVDQHQEVEVSPPKGRRICNELVHEFCLRIPTAKTSDSIMLTAHNMYAYLTPLFSKKLIYRDAIAFLKAMMKTKKQFYIRIDVASQNKENEPIVVTNQKQWVDKGNTNFELETNKICVEIGNRSYSSTKEILIFHVGKFEYRHSQYFLHLIAPLVQPIQLYLDRHSSRISIARLVHLLNTHWIDSIRLWDYQFDEPIYEALSKYNKLEICERISPVNVPKLVHWLTNYNNNNNNNGQPKKYLFLRQDRLNDGLALLIEELKKEFDRATSASQFVVRLELRQSLDEFTLSNELTEEKLEMRRIGVKEGEFVYALGRFPDNELDDNGRKECLEFDSSGNQSSSSNIIKMSDLMALQTPNKSPNRRMCNELVWELCLRIPTAKTSDLILLAAHNMYAIWLLDLAKIQLIYRDEIAFLTIVLKAKKKFGIHMAKAVGRRGQGQFQESCTNSVYVDQYVNVHLLYFLRLIAPLLRPIQWDLKLEYSSDINIKALVRFLETQNLIDSICAMYLFTGEKLELHIADGQFIHALRTLITRMIVLIFWLSKD